MKYILLVSIITFSAHCFGQMNPAYRDVWTGTFEASYGQQTKKYHFDLNIQSLTEKKIGGFLTFHELGTNTKTPSQAVELKYNKKKNSFSFVGSAMRVNGKDCLGPYTLSWNNTFDTVKIGFEALFCLVNGSGELVKAPRPKRESILVSTTPNKSEPNRITGTTTPEKEIEVISAEGINLLFKNATTKLTHEEKNEIYQLLSFRLTTDKQKFVDKSDNTDEYSFSAEAWPIDLNGDGVEEIVVNWGNTYTSGNAGSSVTMFIKNGKMYQENFGFGGDLYQIIPSMSNGFPDLSFGVPGTQIPIWRYNGSQYNHHKSVSEAEYKKLKAVSVESFKKNPKLVLDTKRQQANSSASTLSNDDIIIPPSKSNPNAKTLILKRWLIVNVIGSHHDMFVGDKERGITREFQFTSGGKCFAYEKGLLSGTFNYIMAPDGKSMLWSIEGDRRQMSIEILSITSKEMIIKFPMYYGSDKVVMRIR